MDKQGMFRNLACAAAIVAMLALSSCNAPGDSAAGASPDSKAPATQAATGQPATPATPAALPAPATPASGAEGKPAPPPLSIDADKGRTCNVDADCAMKDAGSCCGYRPACVNKDTPTFPEKVKAACAKDGRVGICGFPAIEGCQCVAGKCEGVLMMENSELVQ